MSPTRYVPLMDLEQTLHRHFGFSEFRPGQRAVIGHVVEGNDALVVMPTGHGKSLCYQLPALVLLPFAGVLGIRAFRRRPAAPVPAGSEWQWQRRTTWLPDR